MCRAPPGGRLARGLGAPRTRRGPAAAARLLVTLGELVEAVASVTMDPGEQALVVDHILRTRKVRGVSRGKDGRA